MVQSIEVRKVKVSAVEQRKNMAYQDYLLVLKDYWSGKNSAAIDLISEKLLTVEDHEYDLLMYRLWIEILAEENDLDSLKIMSQHLLKRCREDFKPERWYGLRALLNLELDELDACKLMSKHFERVDKKCPYFVEFVQKAKARGIETLILGTDFDLSEVYFSPDSFDFLCWKSHAQWCLEYENDDTLNGHLDLADVMFPEFTLKNFFHLHLNWDDQKYGEALKNCLNLLEKFPENRLFLYYQGLLNRKLGEVESAQQILQEIDFEGEAKNWNDFPVKYELAETNREMYEQTKNKAYLQKSEAKMIELSNSLQNIGLSDSLVNQKIYEYSQWLRGNKIDHNFEPLSYWLVVLSDQEFNKLMGTELSEISRVFRPMGQATKEGDIVFYVGKDSLRKDKWRLGAIYHISLAHNKDFIWGEESSLDLLKRFEGPVHLNLAIDSQVGDESGADSSSYYGVYRLDNSAFDLIRESIKFYLNEIGQFDVDMGQHKILVS